MQLGSILIAFTRYAYLCNIAFSLILLPLRLLPRQKLVQDAHAFLQSTQPLFQLGLHLRIIISQLLIEVLPVWCCAHGKVENGLYDERVVGLEGLAIGIAERVGKFFGRVGDVVAEGLGGEVKAAGGDISMIV